MNIGWVLKFNRGKMTTTGYLNGCSMVVAEKGNQFEWYACRQQGTTADLESAQRAAVDCVLAQRGQS